MSAPPTTPSPSIDGLLARLRQSIRRYLWLRGTMLVIAAVGLGFWLLLGIDWTFEPSRDVRLGLLVLAGIGIVYVFFRLIVSRVFVRLPDRSMAVLVERRYPAFNESLLTTIELGEHTSDLPDFTREMLEHTQSLADEQAGQVEVATLFNRRPLRASIVSAVVPIVLILVLALAAPNFMRVAAARLSGTSDRLYPRETRLVIEGFPDGEAVVAKGGDLRVTVKAATDMVVPEVVQIRYHTEDGGRERRNMVREGAADPAHDEYQPFRYDFQGILAPIDFEVRGNDARLRDLRIRVVESPSITSMLYVEYPAYMQQSPRELPVTAVNSIPVGSRVTLRATANKDLVRTRVLVSDAEGLLETHDVPLAEGETPWRQFEYTLEVLKTDTSLAFTLFDTDGIQNREPVRVALTAEPDDAPEVAVRLVGIGSAITPQARLPLAGTLRDDHGLAKTWIDLRIDENEPQTRPLATQPGGAAEQTIDEALEVRDFALTPGQKVVVSAVAADARHLPWEQEPNIGQGERFVLDVVTPEQLRAMLESRELNLRQRFETIIAEMIETRDTLALVELSATTATPATETAETDATSGDQPLDPAQAAERSQQRGRLRVERALQNGRKNAEETEGVAVSFEAIREELVNNRVDTEELRIRLKDNIADPLRLIATEGFAEFETRLDVLNRALTADAATADKAKAAAVAQADTLVVEMQRVRDKMLELETFNEAVDLLRAIIDSQQRVTEETRRQRAEKVKKLLDE